MRMDCQELPSGYPKQLWNISHLQLTCEDYLLNLNIFRSFDNNQSPKDKCLILLISSRCLFQQHGTSAKVQRPPYCYQIYRNIQDPSHLLVSVYRSEAIPH